MDMDISQIRYNEKNDNDSSLVQYSDHVNYTEYINKDKNNDDIEVVDINPKEKKSSKKRNDNEEDKYNDENCTCQTEKKKKDKYSKNRDYVLSLNKQCSIDLWKDYKIVKQIGKGTTGKIYRGININDRKPVAIKVENALQSKSHLYDEYKMYKYLSDIDGIPKVYDFKSSGVNQVMVMELLGPSVDSMFRYCGKVFSMKTICMLGKRMVTLLESVHRKGVVYRDVKPENFVVGNVINYLDDDQSIENISSRHLSMASSSTFNSNNFSKSSSHSCHHEVHTNQQKNQSEKGNKNRNSSHFMNTHTHTHTPTHFNINNNHTDTNAPTNSSNQEILEATPILSKNSNLKSKKNKNQDYHGSEKFTESVLESSKEKPVEEDPLNKIYLLDFGLSEFFIDRRTHVHVQNSLRPPCGTPRYMSIHTHQFRQQSRRDDLESLGYLLLYFLKKGNLPWQGITAIDVKSMIYRIWDKKETIPLTKLFKDCPTQFMTYMKYTRNLGFTKEPDYRYLRGLFDEILESINEVDDGVFDWMVQMEQEKHQKDKFLRRLIYKILPKSNVTIKYTSPSLILDIQANKHAIEKVTKKTREQYTLFGYFKRKLLKMAKGYWNWMRKLILIIKV